jgi:hypothetical protein
VLIRHTAIYGRPRIGHTDLPGQLLVKYGQAAFGRDRLIPAEAKLSNQPMNRDPSLMYALFATYGESGAWEALPSTGVASDVYATRDVVLRVATDH